MFASRDALIARQYPAGLLSIVLGAGMIAFLGQSWIADVTALTPPDDAPYFMPQHALLLYVLVPLATLSTGVFLLGPGLLLTAAFGREKGAALGLLSAFAISTAFLVPATAAFQLATGIIPVGETFHMLVLAVTLAALAVASARWASGVAPRLVVRDDSADLVGGAILGWAVLALLAPKFYWESFTGDGAEALEWARLFIHTLWPFWPESAGLVSDAPGLTSAMMIPTTSWYVRLFGEWEFVARAPMIAFLGLLYPVITALIRHGRTVALRPVDHGLLIGALFVYTLSAIYSGGYNPYFGDSPMPAGRETLAMALFMGYALAFIEGRLSLMVAIGLLAHLTIPTGGFWLLLWPAAVLLVWPKVPRARLYMAGLVLVLATMLSTVLPMVIQAIGLPYPGGEFDARAVINRLRFVAFADFNRILFLAIPCGLLPIAFLFLTPARDKLARAMAVATIVYFLFFYLQGYRVLPHHFIPVVAGPLIVFWRSPYLQMPGNELLRLTAGASLVAALLMAWPSEFRLHRFDREIGQSIALSGLQFERDATGPHGRGFKPEAYHIAHALLGEAFPIGWTDEEARSRFFGSPLVWLYYADRPKPLGAAPTYVIKPLADATAEDGDAFAKDGGYGLFVRDPVQYQRHATMRLPTNTGAPAFVTPREEIFGRGARWDRRVVIDLVAIARSVLGKKDARVADRTQGE